MQKRRMLGLLVAMIFVAAACGSGDGGSAFGGGGDGGDGDTGAENEGGDGDEGGSDEFCDVAQEIEDLDAQIDANEINLLDPEAAEEAFTEFARLLDEVVDVAPDEIADDLEARLGDTDTILAELEEVDFDVLQLDESLFEETPEREAATERLDAFLEEECGIVDDDTADNADPTDTEVEELIEDSGRGNELTAQAFIAAGLPEDQAQCLSEQITLEELIELGSSGEDPPAEFFVALEDCGVSLSQLAELGAAGGGDVADPGLEDLLEEMPAIDEMPDVEIPGTGDIPPEAIEIFVSTLVAQGFTQAEAECLAPTFLSNPDTASEDALQLFEDCGISLSRLAELGG